MSAALGPESIIGTEAEVVARIYQGHLAQYLVRSRGELWSARYNDTLQPGEKVNVADLIGNNLIVKPENSAVSHEQLSTEGENKDRSRFGRKWCH